MYRYAQITDDGYVVSDSSLSGEVDHPNMIPGAQEAVKNESSQAHA